MGEVVSGRPHLFERCRGTWVRWLYWGSSANLPYRVSGGLGFCILEYFSEHPINERDPFSNRTGLASQAGSGKWWSGSNLADWTMTRQLIYRWYTTKILDLNGCVLASLDAFFSWCRIDAFVTRKLWCHDCWHSSFWFDHQGKGVERTVDGCAMCGGTLGLPQISSLATKSWDLWILRLERRKRARWTMTFELKYVHRHLPCVMFDYLQRSRCFCLSKADAGALKRHGWMYNMTYNIVVY